MYSDPHLNLGMETAGPLGRGGFEQSGLHGCFSGSNLLAAAASDDPVHGAYSVRVALEITAIWDRDGGVSTVEGLQSIVAATNLVLGEITTLPAREVSLALVQLHDGHWMSVTTGACHAMLVRGGRLRSLADVASGRWGEAAAAKEGSDPVGDAGQRSTSSVADGRVGDVAIVCSRRFLERCDGADVVERLTGPLSLARRARRLGRIGGLRTRAGFAVGECDHASVKGSTVLLQSA